MPRAIALWCILMLGGCSESNRAAVEGLRPTSAHWIDPANEFSPSTLWGHFSFDELSFPTPTEGWIVGDKFILHVVSDDLNVTFLRPTGAWLKAVAFRTADDGWVAGSRLPRGVLWRYANGLWEPADIRVNWPDWYVRSVWVSPQAVWARASVTEEGLGPDMAKRRRSVLLHSEDGAGWRVDDSPQLDAGRWSFNDACFYTSDEGWFVGLERPEPNVVRALAVLRRNGQWHQTRLPELDGPDARLQEVVCLNNGHAVALGVSGGEVYHPSQPVLLRHDGDRWQQIELPQAFRRAEIGAMAALSDSDVWLAVSNVVALQDRRATFLHLSGGEWKEVAPPMLPGGDEVGYVFSDMQFVSPDEGWAIANVSRGRGLARGLIFHYRDGEWRNRNWNWHFWNEPWFGLLGY